MSPKKLNVEQIDNNCDGTRDVKKVVVLGGGYAGLLAIARLHQQNKKFDITLIEPKTEFTQRIRLHEALAGKPVKSLAYKNLFASRKVNWIQAWVTKWQPESKAVEIRKEQGETLELNYDYLVYALGSSVSFPSFLLKGETNPNLTLLNSDVESQVFFQRVKNSDESLRVLVAGAGLTGIESACEIAEAFPHAEVELAAESFAFEPFSELGKQQLYRRFEQLGIRCRRSVISGSDHAHQKELGVAIDSLEGNKVTFVDGSEDSYDEIIWCGGFKAAPLAAESGLTVDNQNRVLVNEYLQIPEHPEVFVTGDSARVNQIDGQSLRMGCAVAMPLGIYAGEAIKKVNAEKKLDPFRFAFVFRCISLGRRDALIQFTRYDDQPRNKVWIERKAVWTKELICRMTLAMVKWELSSGWSLYRWPEPPARNKQAIAEKDTGNSLAPTNPR